MSFSSPLITLLNWQTNAASDHRTLFIRAEWLQRLIFLNFGLLREESDGSKRIRVRFNVKGPYAEGFAFAEVSNKHDGRRGGAGLGRLLESIERSGSDVRSILSYE